MERELCRAFAEVNHDAETLVVVLTGAGAVFSAGGDFEFRQLQEDCSYASFRLAASRASFSCSASIVGSFNCLRLVFNNSDSLMVISVG